MAPKYPHRIYLDGEHSEELVRFATDHLIDWDVPGAEIAHFQAEARSGDARKALRRLVHVRVLDGMEEATMLNQGQGRVVPEEWLEPLNAAARRDLVPAINKLRELVGERPLSWKPGRGAAKTLRPILDDYIAKARASGAHVPLALQNISRMVETDKGGPPISYWTFDQVVPVLKSPLYRMVQAYYQIMREIEQERGLTVATRDGNEARRRALEEICGPRLDRETRLDWEAKLGTELDRRRQSESKIRHPEKKRGRAKG